MKLQLNHAGPDPLFTGYGQGYVSVAGQRYEHHLLLAPGQGPLPWAVADFDALAAADFEALLALGPELMVFGSGPSLRFPRPDVTRPLLTARVGLEVMDTYAACRTYNILLSEGRKVVAAILVA